MQADIKKSLLCTSYSVDWRTLYLQTWFSIS